MTDEPVVPASVPGSARIASVKAPGAFRTIGEVATMLDIRQHILRYWEEQFPMLRPLKRSGGRRYYRPEDIELLRTIHRLVDSEGYTLRGARLAIESGTAGGAPRPIVAAEPAPAPQIAAIAPPHGAAMPPKVLAGLLQVRRTLADALAAA